MFQTLESPLQTIADKVYAGVGAAIEAKQVTYDFARMMDGANELKCSEFGTAVIARMD